MLSRRRLKRNLKRALIPLEMALAWILGPLALCLYWLQHAAASLARLAGMLFTHNRF